MSAVIYRTSNQSQSYLALNEKHESVKNVSRELSLKKLLTLYINIQEHHVS